MIAVGLKEQRHLGVRIEGILIQPAAIWFKRVSAPLPSFRENSTPASSRKALTLSGSNCSQASRAFWASGHWPRLWATAARPAWTGASSAFFRDGLFLKSASRAAPLPKSRSASAMRFSPSANLAMIKKASGSCGSSATACSNVVRAAALVGHGIPTAHDNLRRRQIRVGGHRFTEHLQAASKFCFSKSSLA